MKPEEIADILEACYLANDHPYPMGLALRQAVKLLRSPAPAGREISEEEIVLQVIRLLRDSGYEILPVRAKVIEHIAQSLHQTFAVPGMDKDEIAKFLIAENEKAQWVDKNSILFPHIFIGIALALEGKLPKPKEDKNITVQDVVDVCEKFQPKPEGVSVDDIYSILLNYNHGTDIIQDTPVITIEPVAVSKAIHAKLTGG